MSDGGKTGTDVTLNPIDAGRISISGVEDAIDAVSTPIDAGSTGSGVALTLIDEVWNVSTRSRRTFDGVGNMSNGVQTGSDRTFHPIDAGCSSISGVEDAIDAVSTPIDVGSTGTGVAMTLIDEVWNGIDEVRTETDGGQSTIDGVKCSIDGVKSSVTPCLNLIGHILTRFGLFRTRKSHL